MKSAAQIDFVGPAVSVVCSTEHRCQRSIDWLSSSKVYFFDPKLKLGEPPQEKKKKTDEPNYFAGIRKLENKQDVSIEWSDGAKFSSVEMSVTYLLMPV